MLVVISYMKIHVLVKTNKSSREQRKVSLVDALLARHKVGLIGLCPSNQLDQKKYTERCAEPQRKGRREPEAHRSSD